MRTLLTSLKGFEGVTLRKLVKRLNVYAPALYWHFKNKGALANEMAEAILRMEFSKIKSSRNNEPCQDWLVDTFNRLRKVLLSYEDGVRVVDGAQLALAMDKVTAETLKTFYIALIPLFPQNAKSLNDCKIS